MKNGWRIKKTILIVDDVEMNCKMLSVILSEKYHTLEADNGKQQWKSWRKHRNRFP